VETSYDPTWKNVVDIDPVIDTIIGAIGDAINGIGKFFDDLLGGKYDGLSKEDIEGVSNEYNKNIDTIISEIDGMLNQGEYLSDEDRQELEDIKQRLEDSKTCAEKVLNCSVREVSVPDMGASHGPAPAGMRMTRDCKEEAEECQKKVNIQETGKRLEEIKEKIKQAEEKALANGKAIDFKKLLTFLKEANKKGEPVLFDYTQFLSKSYLETVYGHLYYDVPYELNGKKLNLRGQLNTKKDYILVKADNAGSVVEINKGNLLEKDRVTYKFYQYYQEGGRTEENKAITLETDFIKDYEGLLQVLEYTIAQSGSDVRKYYVEKFKDALDHAKAECNDLDYLYEEIPDFVVQELNSDRLWEDLTTLSNCSINRPGTDENKAVLNIIRNIDSKYLTQKLNSQPMFVPNLLDKIDGSYTAQFISELTKKLQEQWSGDENLDKIYLTFSKFPQLGEGVEVVSCYGFDKKHKFGYTFALGDMPSNSEYNPANCINIKVKESSDPVLLQTDAEGENLFVVPAAVAGYMMSEVIKQSYRDFLSQNASLLMPELLIKPATLAKWSRFFSVAKGGKITTTEELIKFLDAVNETTTVAQLEERGIKVFFRGTTRNADGSLFLGNPNTIANGISTSTDPIKSTIFAIESATNSGGKGVLQIALPNDLKNINLLAPNRRVNIELEVVFETSAESFSKLSKVEIPVEKARQAVKEIYGIELPSTIRRNVADELLRTLPASSLEQSFNFYQKILK